MFDRHSVTREKFMSGERNETMGRIIGRAWSDSRFKRRLLADPVAGISELEFLIPEGKSIVAIENTSKLIHIVLTSPRYTETQSAYADIKEFGEAYWDPRLFPLKWGSHDPVFTARFKADPKAALRTMDVHVPDLLRIKVVENSRTQAHLALPLQPPASELSKGLLDKIAQGRIPATMRYAGLVPSISYDQLFWEPAQRRFEPKTAPRAGKSG